MAMPTRQGARMGALQQEAHGAGHDYAEGSPHIRHFPVRRHITETLQAVALDVLQRQGTCRVLEIGAGHGTFTDDVLATGATAVVTEMSASSVAELRRRFRHNDRVEIVPDPDGSAASAVDPVDVVVAISVLHHVPDYLGAVRAWTGRTRPGGTFVSFQDPLWYPRRSRRSLLADRAAYLSWRVPRGDLTRGLRTAARRSRRAYDETNPSDMVEYHVMRDGVDELALAEQLEGAFEEVALTPYWSSQGTCAQVVGHRVCRPNTFGLLARGRRPDVPQPGSGVRSAIRAGADGPRGS